MNTGDKIAKARRAQNLTQEQLADMLNVSRQAVSRWESGLAYPETDNLVRLSEILNVNCDYLLKDGVNEDGEKIMEVKIVREVPATRQINFRFVLMIALVLCGVYFALAGTWNVVTELIKEQALRRQTEIIVLMGVLGVVGYALIAWGVVLAVKCIKRREYFFIKPSERE